MIRFNWSNVNELREIGSLRSGTSCRLKNVRQLLFSVHKTNENGRVRERSGFDQTAILQSSVRSGGGSPASSHRQ